MGQTAQLKLEYLMTLHLEKYGWLNRVKAIGKMVGLSTDPARSFVRHDIFAVF